MPLCFGVQLYNDGEFSLCIVVKAYVSILRTIYGLYGDFMHILLVLIQVEFL